MDRTPLEEIDWPVRTDRLLLRPATSYDADATWVYRGDPETAAWLTRLPSDVESWRAFMADPANLARTVVMEHEGTIVGDLYLHLQDGWAQHEVKERAAGCEAEIGWVLAPDWRGRGLAREGVRALLALCFEGLGLRRVVAGCFAVNEPSWRLMEHLGMRRESHTRADALHRELGWMDGMTYGILAEEWRALRG